MSGLLGAAGQRGRSAEIRETRIPQDKYRWRTHGLGEEYAKGLMAEYQTTGQALVFAPVARDSSLSVSDADLLYGAW